MGQTPVQKPSSNIAPLMPLMLPARESKGVVSKIIGLVLILAVVVPGVLLVARIWDPFWSPFRPDPQKILQEALNKADDWRTQRIDAFFGIDLTDEVRNSNAKIVFRISGDFDKENKRVAASVDLSLGVKGPGANQSLAAKISLDSIVSGTDAYVNLRKADLPQAVALTAAMAGVDIAVIQGQWIKIDSASLPAGIVGSQNSLSQGQQQQITTELQNIISGVNLSKAKQQLPDEIVDGQKSYHYLVAFDKEGMKQAASKFVEKIPLLAAMMGVPTTNSEQSIHAMNQQINEFLDNVGDLTYEVFIGKNDGELRRLKGEKEIDISKFNLGQQGKVVVNINVDYSNINKPVDIQAPASFKTLQEILAPIQGK